MKKYFFLLIGAFFSPLAAMNNHPKPPATNTPKEETMQRLREKICAFFDQNFYEHDAVEPLPYYPQLPPALPSTARTLSEEEYKAFEAEQFKLWKKQAEEAKNQHNNN